MRRNIAVSACAKRSLLALALLLLVPSDYFTSTDSTNKDASTQSQSQQVASAGRTQGAWRFLAAASAAELAEGDQPYAGASNHESAEFEELLSSARRLQQSKARRPVRPRQGEARRPTYTSRGRTWGALPYLSASACRRYLAVCSFYMLGTPPLLQ